MPSAHSALARLSASKTLCGFRPRCVARWLIITSIGALLLLHRAFDLAPVVNRDFETSGQVVVVSDDYAQTEAVTSLRPLQDQSEMITRAPTVSTFESIESSAVQAVMRNTLKGHRASLSKKYAYTRLI